MADDVDKIEDRSARRRDAGGNALVAECFPVKEPTTAKVLATHLDAWKAIGGWRMLRREGRYVHLAWAGEGDPVRPRRS